MAAIMDVDENLKQTYIQYDPAPRKGNEVQKKRVPDYFLWIIILHSKLSLFAIIIFVVILLKNINLMSASLSPIRSSKDSLRFSSKGMRNNRLHVALDEAKNYSE